MKKIYAHAKINWFLEVVSKRPDGYHDLNMLMQRIHLHDTLHLIPADHISLQIVSDPVSRYPINIPTDESNIILRAIRLLQQHCNISAGARIVLEKRIPQQAGLGGGSADAAATLQGLNILWGLNLSSDQMAALGLQLGADVPYCLQSKPAIVGGIGEQVNLVDIPEQYALLLIQPQAGISTAKLFTSLSDNKHNLKNSRTFCLEATLQALKTRDFSLLRTSAINDLQIAAQSMVPQISEIQHTLYTHGAAFAQMTGAGSAVYGVFPSQQDAERAMAALSPSYPHSILTHSLSDATVAPSARSNG
jgi:4-diphosphocytidyl-2-C-methyl-D-erythritol kinase